MPQKHSGLHLEVKAAFKTNLHLWAKVSLASLCDAGTTGAYARADDRAVAAQQAAEATPLWRGAWFAPSHNVINTIGSGAFQERARLQNVIPAIKFWWDASVFVTAGIATFKFPLARRRHIVDPTVPPT
jgi:hypothetical protein